MQDYPISNPAELYSKETIGKNVIWSGSLSQEYVDMIKEIIETVFNKCKS